MLSMAGKVFITQLAHQWILTGLFVYLYKTEFSQKLLNEEKKPLPSKRPCHFVCNSLVWKLRRCWVFLYLIWLLNQLNTSYLPRRVHACRAGDPYSTTLTQSRSLVVRASTQWLWGGVVAGRNQNLWNWHSAAACQTSVSKVSIWDDPLGVGIMWLKRMSYGLRYGIRVYEHAHTT